MKGYTYHILYYMSSGGSVSFPPLLNSLFFSVLALAFVPLRGGGFEKSPYFFFNMYTGPGFLSAGLALINVLLVVFLFKENRLVRPNQQKMKPVDKSQNCTYMYVSILYPYIHVPIMYWDCDYSSLYLPPPPL